MATWTSEPLDSWEGILEEFGKGICRQHARYRKEALAYMSRVPPLNQLGEECLRFNPKNRISFGDIVNNEIFTNLKGGEIKKQEWQQISL
jgi:hypothetical protein